MKEKTKIASLTKSKRLPLVNENVLNIDEYHPKHFPFLNNNV